MEYELVQLVVVKRPDGFFTLLGMTETATVLREDKLLRGQVEMDLINLLDDLVPVKNSNGKL